LVDSKDQNDKKSKKVKEVIEGFKDGVTELSASVITKMNEAIKQSEDSTYKLKKLIELALLLLGL
jgi:hypothetical protein